MKKYLLALWLSLVAFPAFANVPCTLPFNLQNGTTADASQVMANYNALVSCLAQAAAQGINTDITALNGLTTPITPASGGSVVFLGGTSSGSANAYVIPTTTPNNFTLTQNYTLVFVANFNNTAAATLAANGQTATNIYKQTAAGPIPLVGGEIVAGQIVVAWYDGTQFEISVPAAVSASSLTASTQASLGQPVNMNLTATTASNQLTLSVVGVNGIVPSASNPVLAVFNNAGAAVLATITTQTSFTIGSTSSMGCTTGVLCRLWTELICQTAGSTCTSALIGASVQSTSGACRPLVENLLQTTGSGTGGGTTYNTIQTSVASLTSVPIRIVGFVEAVWTSGIGWGSPSNIVLFSAGIKNPCDTVQKVFAAAASLAITPTSAANLVQVIMNGNSRVDATAPGMWELDAEFYRGATLLAQQIAFAYALSGNYFYSPYSFNWLDSPATTGSTTYSETTIGSVGAGSVSSQIELDEIMG